MDKPIHKRYICKVNHKNVFDNLGHMFLAYLDEDMEWKMFNAYTSNPSYIKFIEKCPLKSWVNVALGNVKTLNIRDEKGIYKNKKVIMSIRFNDKKEDNLKKG